MAQTSVSKQLALWEKRLSGRSETEYELNVIYLYEDAPTRKWAREVCGRVDRLVNPEAVRSTWWNIRDLSQPGVLAGAVSKAMRADLIVIALHAGEGQPLPFYVWVNSWWPHRPAGVGALVALLGAPERPNRQSGRMRKYLRAVASQARLDFILDLRLGKRPLTQSLSPWGYEGGGWG
jgi:hypothetical protein